MNVTIYNSNVQFDASTMVVSFIIHTSCSRNLYLKDRFAGLQLVSFTNPVQRTQQCFQDIDLSFDITTTTNVPFELVSLVTNVNGELYPVDDDDLPDESINPSDPSTFPQSIEFDLTDAPMSYTATSTVVGRTEDGVECTASASVDIFVEELEDISVAPSASPV
eukprot:CAMPEP_0194028766 /NCGR_PEP_ID=MMETSP0009_2-20130614/2669_1 /TAXON_ID=210454 /ORGANISM="Grammatophora oceanica, Strain CCMP 410" /LENGTH=163 /DNA_ID=CAMNT_0038668255 /DNA_START=54 /DNA_END=545 /DNA_ORIENTATION=-